MKRLGLSLDEIAAVIALYFKDASGIRSKEKVPKILQTHLTKVDFQLHELTAFKRDLETNIAHMHKLIAQAMQESKQIRTGTNVYKSTVNVNFYIIPDHLTGRHLAVLALLMAGSFIVVSQLYVTFPIISGVVTDFGVDPTQASLIGTIFGIAYAIGFLPFGSLSDRYSRKPTLLISLVATGFATVLVGAATSFRFLLTARAIQGLAASIFLLRRSRS